MENEQQCQHPPITYLDGLTQEQILSHEDGTPRSSEELKQFIRQHLGPNTPPGPRSFPDTDPGEKEIRAWFNECDACNADRLALALHEHRFILQLIECHGSDAGRARVKNQIQQEEWAFDSDCGGPDDYDSQQVVARQPRAHMCHRSGKRRTRAAH
ncbi:hypothetical protein JKG47_05990, partial [Acidithiobacillus sp. MC6.1]|nr:hypothetical protein [Acidithiobacillus sp. MC6.1]